MVIKPDVNMNKALDLSIELRRWLVWLAHRAPDRDSRRRAHRALERLTEALCTAEELRLRHAELLK